VSQTQTSLTADAAKKINARRVDSLEDLVAQCDVITIVRNVKTVLMKNCPLHEQTRGLFNKELISKMKKGAWLVNTARGAIVDRHAVKEALESGHLNGYGGDVWGTSRPTDHAHPRCPACAQGSSLAPNAQSGWWGKRNGPALWVTNKAWLIEKDSGTTLDAQKRYADGTQDIIKRYLAGEAQVPVNLIVENGQYASKAYGQRAAATGQKGAGP
jgi:formate dehydrogenase